MKDEGLAEELYWWAKELFETLEHGGKGGHVRLRIIAAVKRLVKSAASVPGLYARPETRDTAEYERARLTRIAIICHKPAKRGFSEESIHSNVPA